MIYIENQSVQNYQFQTDKLMAERKEPRMTLKQYIRSNSLRKQVQKRAISRQSSKQCSTLYQSCNSPKLKKTSAKQSVLQDLKYKLAQIVPNNQELVQILKLLDRAVELYEQQIKRHTQQKQLVTSILQQNTKIHQTRNRANSGLKQSTVFIQGSSQLECSKNQPSFHPNKTQRGIQKNSKEPTQKLLPSCIDQQDSIQIPSIQHLLTTNLKDSPQNSSQGPYKPDDNLILPSNDETLMESIGIDKIHHKKRRKVSGTSNASNLIDSAKFFNQEQEPSEIRFSIRSTLWNNNFEPLALRNTYNPTKTNS